MHLMAKMDYCTVISSMKEFSFQPSGTHRLALQDLRCTAISSVEEWWLDGRLFADGLALQFLA